MRLARGLRGGHIRVTGACECVRAGTSELRLCLVPPYLLLLAWYLVQGRPRPQLAFLSCLIWACAPARLCGSGAARPRDLPL